ncbi:MAG: hypothetical protein U0470_11600 [Anaerolineae bacterium]
MPAMIAPLEVPWFQQSSFGFRAVPVLQPAPPPLTQSAEVDVAGVVEQRVGGTQPGIEQPDPPAVWFRSKYGSTRTARVVDVVRAVAVLRRRLARLDRLDVAHVRPVGQRAPARGA